MKNCTYRLSLGELLARPAVELRLIGSDGDDENGSEAGSDNDSGNGSDNDGTGDDDDKSKGKGTAPDAKDKKIASLEEEKQRHYDLRLEAEAKLNKANDRIKELEKDGTTDEDTKRKLVGLERENEDLKTKLADLRLESEFLKSNKYQWRSASAALKLADLSKVRIDEKTGDVFGLDSALEALAKDSPFLLLKESGNDDDNDDEGKGDKKKRRTGTPPGDKNSQDDKSRSATEAKLRSKYAGLRR